MIRRLSRKGPVLMNAGKAWTDMTKIWNKLFSTFHMKIIKQNLVTGEDVKRRVRHRPISFTPSKARAFIVEYR